MSKRKPVVGETLFSLNVGNSVNQFRPQQLTPVVVHSVGRQYFFAGEKNDRYTTQYHIKDWRQKTDYMATSRLYETEQEYLDDNESDELQRKIKNVFGSHHHVKIPLIALRTIDRIIENNLEK